MSTIPVLSVRLIRSGEVPCDPNRTKTPDGLAEFLRETLTERNQESFWIACLDDTGKITGVAEIETDNLVPLSIETADVFRIAVASNAASIVSLHYDPAWEWGLDVAFEDYELAVQLYAAGEVLNIRQVDYLLVGTADLYSFAANEIFEELADWAGMG